MAGVSTMPEAAAKLASLAARADALPIVTQDEMAALRHFMAAEAALTADVAAEAAALAARRHELAAQNAALRRETVDLKDALAARRGWALEPRATAAPPEGEPSAAGAAVGEAFLRSAPEVVDMNQYWYSPTTISTIVSEVEAVAAAGGQPLTVAFLSTPSVYFSLPEGSGTRASSVAFDYDKQWQGHPNYRFFDFDDAEGTRSATAHFFGNLPTPDPAQWS